MTFFGLSQTPPPTFSCNFVLLQGRMGLKLLLLSAGLILITPGQHHHHHHHKYLCIIAFAINTRDAKSSERGEHARTIFSLLLCYFFGPCTRSVCALVLIFGSSCANVWPKQFGQLTQLCIVSGD